MTVITSISLDHTKQLGDTLEKIAAEKAGIIKPGVPVFCGPLDEASREVIAGTAKHTRAARSGKKIPSRNNLGVQDGSSAPPK